MLDSDSVGGGMIQNQLIGRMPTLSDSVHIMLRREEQIHPIAVHWS